MGNNASLNRRELWFTELDSGRTEPLLPGFPIGTSPVEAGYDISPDGRQVVVEARDSEGKPRLWVAPIDRRSPPRPIPNVEADGPVFGPDGEVFFRAREGTYGFAYRVRVDGTGLRKAVEPAVIGTRAVSRDGRWLVTYSRANEERAGATLAFLLGGGPPIRISGPGGTPKWSMDGRFLFLSLASTSYSGRTGNTYVLPLRSGKVFPEIAAGAFPTEAEIARLPGVRVIGSPDVAPGPTPGVYAFSRERVQRNLYRIPLP